MPSFNSNTFNFNENIQRHDQTYPLMVGFDTETTGLNTTIGKKEKNSEKLITRQTLDEPVSYGLVVYRNGIIQPHEQQHFLVKPTRTISPGSIEIHKWTPEKIARSYDGEELTDEYGTRYAPALDPKIGIHRIAQVLAHYQKQGAVIIGANHKNFDMNILKNTYQKYNNNNPIKTTGFDPDSARMIDVIRHEQAITGSPTYVKLEHLCDRYGVNPGNHKALDDSRAAVDVYLKQAQRVAKDRRR